MSFLSEFLDVIDEAIDNLTLRGIEVAMSPPNLDRQGRKRCQGYRMEDFKSCEACGGSGGKAPDWCSKCGGYGEYPKE